MAKSKAITPITAPNQNNAPDTLIDAESLEKFISKARDHQLLKRQDVLFLKMSEFFSLTQQVKTYHFLLTRTLGITDYNFKMKLFYNAATAIHDANTDAHLEVKDQAYTEMVNIFNNGLRMKCQSENSEIESPNWNTLTENVINNLQKHNEQKALNLAQLSLTQRVKILFDKIKADLPSLIQDDCPSIMDINILSSPISTYLRRFLENKQFSPEKSTEEITAILQACNKIAELANKSDDFNIRIEGLQKAEELYNIATICNDPEFRGQALIHMANLHRLLGYNNKAQALAKLAANISSEDSNIIKKFGHTYHKDIDIKQQKKENLDKIYQAAAIGKWTNEQFSLWGWQEQGVQGYIPKKSDNENDADYNTKMALIFESIVLAINNSENPDPTCAIIFAQKYPEIIKYVIEHHPEYFVNTDMLHICAEKLDIKELQELTNNNKQAPSGYKSYQEKAIIPFIEKRLTTDNIIQKAKGLAIGAWNDYTQGKLLTLFDELEIGNNLGEISDSIKIARILVIKAVIKAIQKKNTGNLAPIKAICDKYLGLIKEISKYHPEYLGENELVLKIVNTTIKQEDKVPTVTQIEEGYHNIEVEQQTQDTTSKIIGDIDSLVEWS